MGERSGYVRVALTILLILAWGSTFAAVKVGVESAPPILFAGLRSVIGGAVMTVLAGVLGGPPRLRAHLGDYGLLTLLNVVAFFGLQTLAILALPSGLAAVLIYLQPVLTGVLASPLLGEVLTGAKALGLLLGFAGIVLVSVGALGGVVGATRAWWGVARAGGSPGSGSAKRLSVPCSGRSARSSSSTSRTGPTPSTGGGRWRPRSWSAGLC
ncbi:MAG TPA: DMT family transporter [Nocardioidaceae bacterium]|nr:DMT family transporter [Nocardioidaceae bacterium]